MRIEVSRLFNAACVGAFWLFLAESAIAQTFGPMPKAFETVDHNGVVLSGYGTSAGGFELRIKEPAVGIGDPNAGGLYWQRWHVAHAGQSPGNYEVVPTYWRNNNLAGRFIAGEDLIPQYAVSLGESGEAFVWHINPQFVVEYRSEQYTGSKIDAASFTWTRSSDGAVVAYSGPLNQVQSVTKPDGEVITYNYYFMPSGPYAGYSRLQSVTNNLNYQVHFKYERDTATNPAERDLWFRIQKVTAIDNSLNPCAPTALSCSDSSGGEWPYLLYGYEGGGTIATVTDRLGNSTRFLYSGNIQTTTPTQVRLTGYRTPQASANDISIVSAFGAPFTITNASGTWTYSLNGQGGATIAGPNGYSRTVTFTGSPNPSYFNMAASVPSVDTVNGRTTTYSYQFDPAFSGTLLLSVTGHDGNSVVYEYQQGRRNVTHERRIAKPGSGLADVHLYASYPEPNAFVCANAKTCNKPSWVTIAGPASGNPSSLPKTDYTYDASHGGVLTVTKPASGWDPYASVRPQVRNTYSYNGTAMVRLSKTSTCATTSSCAGTADETVVETTYNAKRLPSTMTAKEGDGSPSSSVTTTYTSQGDVASINGPLSGTADTTRMYYDSTRRLRAAVGPDPDGGGALLYRVAKTTYDADGNPVTVEEGGVSSPASWNSLAVQRKSTIAYDSYGRKVRDNLINVGTGQPETVTQYSYNSAGQVECVARRMNPAVFASLPAACTQGAAGSFGPDRIVKTTYTVNGDPSVIQSGYGTPLVRNERTFTYLAPSQVGTVKDATNNLTTYEYDGFNRLRKTRYPVTTAGANSSSTTDYEELGYDAAGNIASERRRDGQMVYNSYDHLNRVRFINYPSESDVTNAYDNLDRLKTASSSNGTVTWTYDGLGRVLSEAQPKGTVSYAYDAAGRRTQLTWPGPYHVTYEYDTSGALTAMREAGSTLLASFAYDQLGRRANVTRGSGGVTGYGYDAASRLSTMGHDLATGGSAYDASWTLSYNSASQLTVRSASTSTYEWPYAQTFNDGYTVNGLNQYTAVAGQGLAYDGRGNTTNDTTKTYSYDVMNRLTSASNGAALIYDPTGRLLSISQGGSTTWFLYDRTRLIGEYNGSGGTLRRYAHADGVDDPIVWYEGAGTGGKRQLYRDERGSVIAADTGSAVTTKQYDEYGNAAGAYTGRFQYTGQTWMPELGLYYYKARVYNPDLGRFMQTDPIGYKDQMNLYAYVRNDPVNGVDPTGLDNCEVRGEDGIVTKIENCIGDKDADPESQSANEEAQQRDRVVVTAKKEHPNYFSDKTGDAEWYLSWEWTGPGIAVGTPCPPNVCVSKSCKAGTQTAVPPNFQDADFISHTHGSSDVLSQFIGTGDHQVASYGVPNYVITTMGISVVESVGGGFRARRVSGSWGASASTIRGIVSDFNKSAPAPAGGSSGGAGKAGPGSVKAAPC